MTLSSTTVKVTLAGDGSTVAIPITYNFWDATDLRVVYRDSSGTETVWTNGTQYTVTGGSGSTGTVTISTSPTDYTPANGTTVYVISNFPLTQGDSLPLGGDLPSTTVEARLDKLTRQIQQINEKIRRAPLIKETTTYTDMTMPEPTASNSIRWKSDLTGLENIVLSDVSSVASSVDETDTNTTKDKLVSNKLAYDWEANKQNSLNFVEYGADNTGTNDVTTTWNNALSYCNTNGIDTLYIPQGTYKFSSQPNSIDFALNVVGAGWQNTVLLRDYTPGNADDYFIKVEWSYCSLRDLDIQAGDGTTGGRAVETVLTSSPATYGNWCQYHNMRIVYEVDGTGNGTWKYGFYFDGDDSAGAPSAPGLRDVSCLNCWVFATTTADVYFKTVRQFQWIGGYAAGTWTLTGGTTYDSQNVIFHPVVGGTLTADKTKGLSITGPWTGGTLQSTVDNYNVAVTCDAAWTLNSQDGFMTRQVQFSMGGDLSTYQSGASNTITINRTDTHGGSFATISDLIFNGKNASSAAKEFARIAIKAVDDTASSEDGELRLSTTVGGTAQTIELRMYNGVVVGSDTPLGGAGCLAISDRLFVKSYTVGTLPSASTAAGVIYVSDETGGATLAFSDGSNWRRVQDRAVVA